MHEVLPPEVLTPAFSQHLLQLSHDGIMLMRPVFTPDGQQLRDFEWVYLNPAAQRMLRLPAQPTASFLTLFPTAGAAGVFGFYRDAFLSGQPQHRQNNYQHDGLDGYYLLAAQAVGELLLVSFLDTNDQPRTPVEEELRQSQTREQIARAEAEAERQRLTQLFMQAPAAICILDGPELVYELVNPAYQQLFPGRQLQGRPLLEALPELTDQPVWHTLQQVYRTGQTHLELGIRIPVARTEGGELEDFYFNYIQQARRDALGRIDGVVVFAFTVTEQVLAREQVLQLNQELAIANQELQRSNTRLQRSNADLDTFVYTASHDLKAPITNLVGLIEVLREEVATGSWSDTAAHVLHLMQEATERFRITLDYLTEVTRLEHDATPAAPVELASIIADVQLDLTPLLAETRAHVTVDVAECPRLQVAAKTVRSAVYNFLSNALKYRAAERAPNVHIQCRCHDEEAQLSVTDNGLGMDLTRQPELFNLFRRYHTHVEGAGVGLYTVKRLVEHVGGRIMVQSQVGEGSTFTATFPLLCNP